MITKSLPIKEHEEVPFWFNPYNELYKLVYQDQCEKKEIDNKEQIRVLAVGVFLKKEPEEEIEFQMSELEELVEALGHTCVYRAVQRVDRKNRNFYLKKGKLIELREVIQTENIDYVICNDELFPVQFRDMINGARVPVIDRTLIVLELFDRQTQAKESKLQVKVAEMKYLAPRVSSITLARNSSDRQNGAYFSKGSGESIFELNQRKIKNKIEKLEKEIQKSKISKSVQNKKRQNALKTILVGYTNAGKTSIMNMLTKNDFKVSNQVFMTTSSVYRNIGNIGEKDLLVADTVGFIGHLPSTWIEGFYDTIQEIVSADLILHVVDASDKNVLKKVRIVNDILQDIGADTSNIYRVFNKSDSADIEAVQKHLKEEFPEYQQIMFISALKKTDVELLKSEVIRTLKNIEMNKRS